MGFAALLPAFFGSGIASSQGQEASQRRGGLLLKEIQVPKGARVIGLEIHLAGTFEGISNVPVGWHVSADNDPSGQASLEAHAKPGAAALDKSALLNLGLQVIENEVADEVAGVGMVDPVFRHREGEANSTEFLQLRVR
jgi:hypothetical protein